MFAKYPQEEIKKYWPKFEHLIKENLPPTSLGLKVDTDEMFEKLMRDEMHLWIFANTKGDVIGFLTTSFTIEVGFDFKSLIVYSAIATEAIDEDEWRSALVSLKDFSKKYECKRILAYTTNERVIEIVNMLGGRTDYHLVTLEV